MSKISGIQQVKLINNKLVSAPPNEPNSFGIFFAGGKDIDKKVAAARFAISKGDLFIKNKLSSKPAKAVKTVENIVKSQNRFNFSMKQNYSKNVVEMNLLGRSYGVHPENPEKSGYQIFLQREVPVTAAISTYAKTANEMIETGLKPVQHTQKPQTSLWENFKNIIGEILGA